MKALKEFDSPKCSRVAWSKTQRELHQQNTLWCVQMHLIQANPIVVARSGWQLTGSSWQVENVPRSWRVLRVIVISEQFWCKKHRQRNHAWLLTKISNYLTSNQPASLRGVLTSLESCGNQQLAIRFQNETNDASTESNLLYIAEVLRTMVVCAFPWIGDK